MMALFVDDAPRLTVDDFRSLISEEDFDAVYELFEAYRSPAPALTSYPVTPIEEPIPSCFGLRVGAAAPEDPCNACPLLTECDAATQAAVAELKAGGHRTRNEADRAKVAERKRRSRANLARLPATNASITLRS